MFVRLIAAALAVSILGGCGYVCCAKKPFEVNESNSGGTVHVKQGTAFEVVLRNSDPAYGMWPQPAASPSGIVSPTHLSQAAPSPSAAPGPDNVYLTVAGFRADHAGTVTLSSSLGPKRFTTTVVVDP